ncbi:MAG: hypothetical protein RLZZ450_7673 [Pseudomonadota bacterium]|jgi:uncharacterized protein (DUF2267 family)
MMRRLSEPELSREPARRVGEAKDVSHHAARQAALLAHVQRVLVDELSDEQLESLRPRLEHAIVCGLSSLGHPSAREGRGDR